MPVEFDYMQKDTLSICLFSASLFFDDDSSSFLEELECLEEDFSDDFSTLSPPD